MLRKAGIRLCAGAAAGGGAPAPPPPPAAGRSMEHRIVASVDEGEDEPAAATSSSSVIPLTERLQLEQQMGVRGAFDLEAALQQHTASVRSYRELEGLFPPSEGFRLTEAYAYTHEPYPAEVLADKRRVLERVGGLPRSGAVPRWSPEHMDELQTATFSMTQAGADEFRSAVSRVQRYTPGITLKEAVRYVESGKPTTVRYFERQIAIQEKREEVGTSPYYKDPEMRESSDAAVAEADAAAALLREEGLVQEAAAGGGAGPEGMAARRDLLRGATRRTAEAVQRNPLRFFMHAAKPKQAAAAAASLPESTAAAAAVPAEPAKEVTVEDVLHDRAHWRGSRDPSLTAAEVSAVELEELFAPEVEEAARVRAAEGAARTDLAGVAGSAGVGGTLATPAGLRAHALASDADLAERRTALRQQGLDDLVTPKPISSTIPGGSYTEAARRKIMKSEFHRENPEAAERMYEHITRRDAGQRGRGGGVDEGYSSTALIRLVRRELEDSEDAINEALAQSFAGGQQGALATLGSLARACGERVQPKPQGEEAPVHEWHYHCVKLLLKLRADEAAHEIVQRAQGAGDAGQLRHRFAVVQHDRKKLEKLTSVMGQTFYHDFWLAATPSTAQKDRRQARFFEKLQMLSAGNPGLQMSLKLKDNANVKTIMGDYTAHITDITRRARTLDSSGEWAELDAYVEKTLASGLDLAASKSHLSLPLPIGSPAALGAAFQTYTRGCVLWAWSACLARRSRVTGSHAQLQSASEKRKEAVPLITRGQSELKAFGIRIMNPLRQDAWVPVDGAGKDGSDLELAGEPAGAYYLAKDKDRGLKCDRRDYVAYLLRAYNFRGADEASVNMMREVLANPGSVVYQWPSRSAQHRMALWHRYVASLNMALYRYWRPFRAYERCPLILGQSLASAAMHYEAAAKLQLLPTGLTVSDGCVTAALEASETFQALVDGDNECRLSFRYGLATATGYRDDEAALLAGLPAKQTEALALLEEAGNASVDDDDWVGQGTQARWYVVLLAQQCQLAVWQAGCTDGSTGDLAVWQPHADRLAAVLASASEGPELAHVSARAALLQFARPCTTVVERNEAMDRAAELAAEFVEWFARRGDRRAVLEQRSLWLHTLALAVWAHFRQGRSGQQRALELVNEVMAAHLDSMRYYDAGWVKTLGEWLEGYLEDPASAGDEQQWRASIFFGTADVYLSQPRMTQAEREAFEREHYPQTEAEKAEDGAAASG